VDSLLLPLIVVVVLVSVLVVVSVVVSGLGNGCIVLLLLDAKGGKVLVEGEGIWFIASFLLVMDIKDGSRLPCRV
jgi:hypothetical protein